MKWGAVKMVWRYLLVFFPLRGVEGQRHDDGQRETDEEADDAQEEGILHQRPELHVIEKADEIVKSHPPGQR